MRLLHPSVCNTASDVMSKTKYAQPPSIRASYGVPSRGESHKAI